MHITKDTRILLVDDYVTMRMVTKGLLKSLGVEHIDQASNGNEAWHMIKNNPYHLVLSDWNMPVMNGLELLKAVRGDEKLAHLPFAMITAEAEHKQIQEAIAAGVSDILIKPYNAGRLKTRVEKVLAWKPRKPAGAVGGAPVESDQPRNDWKKMEVQGSVKERGKPTILVVDDTPDNLYLVANLFKEEYRVRIAPNGEKALEICTSEDNPDLVLLDVMMPGIDGFEVARRMREHPASELIPVIFITAMTDGAARQKGMGLGAVDFITKPIDPELLVPRVRNFMRYVELQKQLQYDYDTMMENQRLREDVEHITRHDLKGPLGGVVGLVQTIIAAGALNAVQHEQLRMVEETTLQTLNMINLSSELYKIETGRFQLNAQPVMLLNILRRTAEITGNAFRQKGVAISIVAAPALTAGGKQPMVKAEAMLCYSLFQNLIKNACEAAPDNSTVVIMVSGGTPVSTVIRNKGAVPMVIRDRFFEKFVTHGKQGGTGLGTYSARLLAQAQHGDITLEVSDESNLTSITVTLPAC